MLCDPVRFLEESVTIRVKFQQDCVEAERKLNPFWKNIEKSGKISKVFQIGRKGRGRRWSIS